MKKALVLYYTCSGNTLKIAKDTEEILRNLDWEVRTSDLRSYNKDEKPFEPDLLILGIPVQYWDIPDAALKMIRSLPRFKKAAGFVFTTFGKCVCNSVPYNLARELQTKRVRILGGGQIVMPHTVRLDANTRIGDVETRFGKGEPTEENRVKYKSVIEDIAGKVESGNIEEIDVKGLKKLHTRNAVANVMKLLMTADMRKNPLPPVLYDSDKCIQCRECVDECDYGAITLADNGITIDKNLCQKCYKCIEVCGEQAMYLDWDKEVFWARFIRRFSKNNDTVLVT